MTAQENQATGLEFSPGDSDVDYPPPDALFKALASGKRRRLLAALPSWLWCVCEVVAKGRGTDDGAPLCGGYVECRWEGSVADEGSVRELGS